MRDAEEFEEIELGWTDRAQQPLAPALTRSASSQTQARADAGVVLVGAGVTEAVQAMAEKASVVVAEPVAPAVGPQPEEPVVAAESQPGNVAKPEGRKRGRPKKAESEGKAEAKQGAGKRQKSLFDF